jgi:hypothetical protein
MNKKLVILVILMQPIAFLTFGQGIITVPDSSRHSEIAVSSLNLRPEALVKNDLLIRLNFNFPGYLRTLNTTTGHMDKLSDKTVLNGMLVNVYLDYGISRRLTLFTQIPLSDTHLSSPSGVVTEKGIADIGFGAAYKIVDDKSGNNTMTCSATLYAPTGKSYHLIPSDYSSGMGIVHFKGTLTGIHRSANSALIYSGYYEFRPESALDLNIGDELGVTLIRQNYYKTRYGNFGIEYGGFSSYKTGDYKAGIAIPRSTDFAVDAYAGGWFEYRKNLFLRFGLPYTIYRNGSPLTNYNVVVQLDYHFKF